MNKNIFNLLVLLTVGSLAKAQLNNCETSGIINHSLDAEIKVEKKKISESARARFLAEICSLETTGYKTTSRENFHSWVKSTPNTLVNDNIARKILQNWRVNFIKSEYAKILESQFINTKIKDKKLAAAIKKDSMDYALKMASVDMAIGSVVHDSLAYAVTASQRAPTIADYTKYKNSLEKVIVHVNFQSDPSSATISIKDPNINIGQTACQKGLDANSEYTFIVEKEGYETIEEAKYIAPNPTEQTFKFILKKKN